MYKTDRPLVASPRTPLPRAYIAGLAAGIILFIPSALLAHAHQLDGFQASWFHAINNLPGGFGTAALWIVDILAQPYGIILCVLIPALMKRLRLSWRYLATAGGTAVLTEIAKKVIAEPRPVVLLHGHLHERAIEHGLTSYPSGHTAMATALALTTWLILPARWRWVCVVWIVVVAFGRVYLGVHSANDVFGGFLLGLIGVCIVRLLPAVIARPLMLDQEDRLLEKNQLSLKKGAK